MVPEDCDNVECNSHLLTGLVITVSMTLLLVLSGALLFILQVCHCLIHHVTVLPVDHRALLLTLQTQCENILILLTEIIYLCIKHCSTLGLSKLIAVLLVANILNI